MRINNNMMAMNTHRQLGISNNQGSKSMEKLSSGFRINRAGDDAAGLAISEKMRGQIRGLNMASRNAQDGISMIQTAEGALQETHAILQRMRELAVQSANDTNVAVDRGELQKEVDQLAAEITRIAETTQFNTQDLLTGSFSGAFHIGANANQSVTLDISDMSGAALKVGTVLTSSNDGTDATLATEGGTTVATHFATGDEIIAAAAAITDGSGNIVTPAVDAVEAASSGYYAMSNGGTTQTATVFKSGAALDDEAELTVGINISTQENANTAITTINNAIESVSAERSKLGAMQNRLEHTIKNLDTSSENLQASESRIRDVDMAKEMMEFTKNNILQQAAQAMLAQANQAPQGVLQLLR